MGYAFVVTRHNRANVVMLAALAATACGGQPRATVRPSAPATTKTSPAGRVIPAATGPLDAPAIMADVRWMCHPDRAGRGSYQPGAKQTADYIARKFKKLGLEVIRQHLYRNADNVIGIFRGGDEAIVVSAHYDHLGVQAGVVYPGADDNASGASVLLALARDAVERSYARTIVFVAFGAEEAGLVGSRYYITHPAWPLAKTAGVINFDMVGRNFFEAGADKPATVGVIGLEADAKLAAAARAAAKRAHMSVVAAPAKLVRMFGFAYRTDDWWFRGRIPVAVHFSTGFHPDYHKPTDTVDKLVPSQLAGVAHTAAGLLRYMARAKGSARD